MDFEYDVFISYTHLDNKPLSKDEEGWISRFHYSFNIRLAQLLGRVPKIWRDNKLQGNDEFSDEIIARLYKAKVMLAVISPSYLNSLWCKKELDLFLNAAEKSNIGHRIGNKSRVFKVVKTHVPYDRHPGELRGLIGYEFYELDENNRTHEFNPDKGSGFEKKYWQRLNEVAGDIYKLIDEIDYPKESGTENRLLLHALGDRQSSTVMTDDIKIIKQIEKQIGEKLKPLPLKNIMNLGNNGYVLNHVKQVQGLNLDGKKVEDISFLRDLGGLTHLSLANNQITDLTPLRTLTNLRNLELRNNKIEDITPLAALTHLERLILINTGISDISPLSGLIDINTLSLSFNKIIDLSPLIPLTSLTSLQLNKNKINDLTPLSALTQLEILGVRINRIIDLTPLKELINLEGLNVSRNKITKLPPDIYRWRWWSSMEIIWDDDDTTDKGFYLSCNPLINPPVDIVKQGKAAVKNYFESLGDSQS